LADKAESSDGASKADGASNADGANEPGELASIYWMKFD
jgi:hypothetical protein